MLIGKPGCQIKFMFSAQYLFAQFRYIICRQRGAKPGIKHINHGSKCRRDVENRKGNENTQTGAVDKGSRNLQVARNYINRLINNYFIFFPKSRNVLTLLVKKCFKKKFLSCIFSKFNRF